jgi:hypothetical protein
MIKGLCAIAVEGRIETRMEGSPLVNAVFMCILSRGGIGLAPQRATQVSDVFYPNLYSIQSMDLSAGFNFVRFATYQCSAVWLQY